MFCYSYFDNENGSDMISDSVSDWENYGQNLPVSHTGNNKIAININGARILFTFFLN